MCGGVLGVGLGSLTIGFGGLGVLFLLEVKMTLDPKRIGVLVASGGGEFGRRREGFGGFAVPFEHEHAGKLRLDGTLRRFGLSRGVDLRRNLLFTLRSAYVQVLQAKAVVDNAKENLAYWDRELELSRSRLAAGDMAEVDLSRLELTLPLHVGKNFDALYDSVTDPLHKSGPQPGFIAVLEHIPANGKFDKEAREQLLDIFRDAADYWGDRKIPFRCFYSFL